MNTVVVGFGSNIESEKNIASARQMIRDRFVILKETEFIKTLACGDTQQPDFTNGAVLVKTDLDRVGFKAVLRSFEEQMGRTKLMTGNAPRIIDLDIHVWNDEIIDPHFYSWPFVRNFVLELIPELPYDLNKVEAA